MLDWKNERATAPASRSRIPGQSRVAISKHSAEPPDCHAGRHLCGGAPGPWLYWSREPDLFPGAANAQLAAESGQKMVPGFTTAKSLKTVAGTLPNKPGGYGLTTLPAGCLAGQHSELGMLACCAGA